MEIYFTVYLMIHTFGTTVVDNFCNIVGQNLESLTVNKSYTLYFGTEGVLFSLMGEVPIIHTMTPKWLNVT